MHILCVAILIILSSELIKSACVNVALCIIHVLIAGARCGVKQMRVFVYAALK